MIQKHFKIVIGVLIVIAAVTAVAIRKRQPVTTAKSPPVQHRTGLKIKGPENAAVTIVEYSDFQCPSCAASQEPLHELVGQFKEVVRVEFRHFPLEMHRFALKAAIAAECASDSNQFWDYQDLLFKHQSVWSRDPDPQSLLMAFGNNLKLNPNQFFQCQQDPQIERRVMADKQSGDALKVQSTPTFFINEERVVGSKQLKENGPAVIKKILETVIQNRS